MLANGDKFVLKNLDFNCPEMCVIGLSLADQLKDACSLFEIGVWR